MDAAAVAGCLKDWSDAGSGRLGSRLALAIRHAIDSGVIADGAHLPAERLLAVELGVSRSVITAALDELKALDLVASRRGSGSWVTARPKPTGVGLLTLALEGDGLINLAAAVPFDRSHLSHLDLTGHGVPDDPAHGYAPLGTRRLRVAIGKHLSAGGCGRVDPDQVMVTSGAHVALQRVLSGSLRRGERVVVERHTYGGLAELFAALGLEAELVEMDDAGPIPDALDAALARSTAAVLQSGIANPTGRRPTQQRLETAAHLLDRHNTVVIDDRATSELWDRTPPPGLATLCERAPVYTVGSLSKIAWGGLRIGWIAAAPVLSQPIHEAERLTHLGLPLLAQSAGVVVLEDLVDRRSERISTLDQRRSHAADLVERLLPGAHVSPSDGGACLWIRTPLADTRRLASDAALAGVSVLPGGLTRLDQAPDPHLRLCADRPLALLDEGVRRLARAWDRHLPQGR